MKQRCRANSHPTESPKPVEVGWPDRLRPYVGVRTSTPVISGAEETASISVVRETSPSTSHAATVALSANDQP